MGRAHRTRAEPTIRTLAERVLHLWPEAARTRTRSAECAEPDTSGACDPAVSGGVVAASQWTFAGLCLRPKVEAQPVGCRTRPKHANAMLQPYTLQARWKLWLPALLTLAAPVLNGSSSMGLATTAYLVLAYILVGLREETLYRGIILRMLRPIGPARSVLLTAVLFGSAHLANLLVRSNHIWCLPRSSEPSVSAWPWGRCGSAATRSVSGRAACRVRSIPTLHATTDHPARSDSRCDPAVLWPLPASTRWTRNRKWCELGSTERLSSNRSLAGRRQWAEAIEYSHAAP